MVLRMSTHDTDIPPRAERADFGFAEVPREARQRLVNDVFARVARRYDLMNDVMSGGLHRLWKDAVINWMAPPRSRSFRLIDVAGGTGDIAARFLRAGGPSAQAIICDISAEMLDAGRARLAAGPEGARLTLVQANAEALPVCARSCDAYTIAFGIRNVTDRDAALREAFRVLKPGGRFLCLEFSQVQVPFLDRLYDAYSFNLIPRIGEAVAGDGEAYRYLVESIARFPDQDSFAAMITSAGFARVQYRNLSGGIAAIHSGWRL
jgi:demethylmenaquinone methyltransferase/2-methoxy-6-polyprenyl-1,4-benzoquinol methylase